MNGNDYPCCWGCDARLSGTSACHCTVCHHTFSVPRNFDAHRIGGSCVEPVNVGLVKDDRSYWVRPCDLATQERLSRARAARHSA